MAVEVDCSLSLGSANVEQTYFVPFPPDAFPLKSLWGKGLFSTVIDLDVSQLVSKVVLK